MPELIRLEIETTSLKQGYAGSDLKGRERRLYIALLAITSVNVFLLSGALSFLWLVFRN